jgi:agmatine deiminase
LNSQPSNPMEDGQDYFVFPAEWEEHSRIWFAWPSGDQFLKGYSIWPCLADMIFALLPHVPVAIIVSSAKQKLEVALALRRRYLVAQKDGGEDWEKIKGFRGTQNKSIMQMNQEAEEELQLERKAAEAESDERTVFNLLLSDVLPEDQRKRLTLFDVPHSDVWMRDFGPIFVRNSTSMALKIVAFDWNMWGATYHLKGYDPTNPTDATTSYIINNFIAPERDVGPTIARQLGLDVIQAGFVSEGGNREFNGKGTLIVCEAVELQRNPHLSRDQLTDLFMRIFHLTNVIWMKNGLADDRMMWEGKLPGGVYNMPCTGGHVDEYVRWVDENTVLLAQVIEEEPSSPIGRISHTNMETNYEILSNSTDHAGRPLRILRIPLPPAILTTITTDSYVYQMMKEINFNDGTELDDETVLVGIVPASYCNFLVTNGVVLVPFYWKPGRSDLYKRTDAMARQILEDAFPGRRVVQIDVESLNYGGGGMHCITQQQPVGKEFTQSKI